MTDVLQEIRESAEAVRNGDTQRFPESATAGDYFRQGDLYIIKRDTLPGNAIRVENPSLQLVEGQTKGSRHCLDSLESVTVYREPDANALQGPWLQLATERTITHPEHGNVVLPCGIYENRYQRAFAEELRRVMD